MRSIVRPASALLAAASIVAAGPFPRGPDNAYAYLFQRDACDGTPCGSDSQYCCDSTELCTTLSGNVATCLGGYGAYTSTWTETRTFTTTYYTHWVPVPTPTAGVDCVPQDDSQQACGPICCAGWQTCAFQGQCSSRPGYAEPTPIVIVTNGHTTTQYSAPYRVTGTTTITTQVVQTGTGTATETGASATSTSDGEAIGADGSKGTNGGGLSPGAIAGIVIGTLAGVALLLLLCFCCIARGLWAAIFGRRRSGDDSVREEVIEERYSKSGSRAASASAHSRRDRHGGWFGGSSRQGTSTVVTDRREKRKSSAGCWTWLGIGAVAATLFTLLNLKKDKRPNSRKTPSRYSDSYYSYTDYTSSNSKFLSFFHVN
ncbi:uncharacterized protein TRIVIDRAFT_36127 [Trichoderma virens Gv29-8]|uniref:Mid2 domain-containing protein n=1 Tax=Hypocrea virens (strain Gv29-8 / FGSC 10586) TaxID=413071 RepID=G9MG26_HYPVG|nr:uncharacterized protein TRIVIDRAFT_36127 [Trichoderma virens Gv29-8]EHK26476.1 hypothetical protein TRIVIDRAFT_36127 [Trichoderma virens Gv29-8]UKZ46659.1 hypothetical protein TrVGV298_000865 [Trichoderma virens]